MAEMKTTVEDLKSTPRGFAPPLWTMCVALMAIVAIGVCLMSYLARRQNLIVDYVHDRNGYLTFDISGTSVTCRERSSEYRWSGGSPSLPDWLIELVGPTLFYDVIGIKTDGPPSQRFLAELKRQPRLETLWLTRCPDRDFESQIDGLSNLKLKKASFHKTWAGDKTIHELRDMKSLEYLDLTRTRVSNQSLRDLAGLTNLRALKLRRCKVTLDGAEWLKEQLPRCKIEWESLTEQGVHRL